MAKWIRKVKHDLTSFRVSIPAVLVAELGWESCRYVVVEKILDCGIFIGRMPGDGKAKNEGPEHTSKLD